MAIRKLSWEIGDSMGIRERGEKLADDLVLKYLDDVAAHEEQLVVKCGKSFWDVTNAPEIFERGEEFDPNSVTEIDRAQMGAPTQPKPAFQTAQPAVADDPMKLLFQKTEPNETDDKPEKLERKTYFLRPTQIEALAILCHNERVEVSVMVREIFDRGMASIAEQLGYDDLFAEAESNIARRGTPGKSKTFKPGRR